MLDAACAFHGGGPWKSRAEISYFDRDGDGKADLEKHVYPGSADADWLLEDNNHDGRYERKVQFGDGIITSTVDLPVPTGVRIKRSP